MASTREVEVTWGGSDPPLEVLIIDKKSVEVEYESGRIVRYFYNRKASEVG